MLTSGKIKYGFLFMVMMVLLVSTADAQKLWSQVKLNRSVTYVNQPVEVTITVYTSTWFTSGIDPGNVKVNGAFTTYFRPVSTSFVDKGQNYAGVQLIYHVFPFEKKDVVFPSLTLELETPPDGDYVGVLKKLKTKERLIKVRPVPSGFSKSDWLVANGLKVADRWNRSSKQVKVGDVLERKITRTAYGTVAELIPPINWDTVRGVSLYPTRSQVENFKTKTAISASRTETMRYLFEKEGKVTLPEIVFTWYHPYHKKLYKKTLEEVTVLVASNPDLGMLSSVRDSLLVDKKHEEMLTKDDQPFGMLGLTWQELVKYGIGVLVVAYFMTLLIKRTVLYIQLKRKAYLHSEAFYFHEVKKAVRRNDRKMMLNSLYSWLAQLEGHHTSLTAWVNLYGTIRLKKEVLDLENDKEDFTCSISEWVYARKSYLREVHRTHKPSLASWINP
ncbi:hypothetical protein [Reichenbachiella sp.]|uniref:hypothetical protein n=1 Tax=Reichenbachiella sp. TaxID=2184521 RepID=UPI003BAE484D